MNTLLHSNILESEYFRALYQLKTYHEVIDEIYRSVQHVEAWQVGTSRIPSTCFCLLLKFMLMKLTYKQMKGILETEDCPYVRAVGLLYLRYTCPPKDLWKWYEPFLEDEEEINPSADPSISMTIGEYCIKLLTDMQYFGTTLPRIPVPIERKMKVMLLLLDEKKRRRRTNQRPQELGLFCEGAKIRAIYGDDENEPCWYEAIIDSLDVDNTNKYWVTFPEYGNTECVDIGDMEIIPDEKEKEKEKEKGEKDSSRNKNNNRDRSTSRSKDNSRNNRDSGRDRNRDKSRDRSKGRDKDRDSRKRSNSRERQRDRSRDRDNDSNGRDKSSKSSKDTNNDRDRDRDRKDDKKSKRKNSRSRSRSKGRDNRGESRSERDTDDRRGGGERGRDKRDNDRRDDRDSNRGRDRDRDRDSRSRSQATDTKEIKEVAHEETLMEKVMKLQRDASAAVGRNYGNRPASYKGSLALKVDRYTVRKKSQSPERRRAGGGGGGGGKRLGRSRSRSPGRSNGGSNRNNGERGGEESSMMRVEISREQQDRMKRLREQYGDASSR